MCKIIPVISDFNRECMIYLMENVTINSSYQRDKQNDYIKPAINNISLIKESAKGLDMCFIYFIYSITNTTEIILLLTQSF